MSTRYLKDPTGNGMRVVDVDGYLMPSGFPMFTPEQIKQQFKYIRNYKCRDDDVMLLTYPKTGTNWLNEVILKLLNKSPEAPVISKGLTMLEFQTQEKIDTIPSPRCLNTHVQLKYLPKELKEKQLRTVLVVRNPKDATVSYYNHVVGIRSYDYSGEWRDWYQLYMKGEMEYGMYTDYLREFEKAIADGIGFPLHVLHYEKLKMNGLEEMKKLAKFLGIEADEELCRKILDKCSFDSMKTKEIVPEEMKQKFFKDDFQFFRKGEIGDWMNWFTVAENEQFDRYWGKEMADSKFKFIYKQN